MNQMNLSKTDNFVPTVTLSLEQYENLVLQTECINDLVSEASSTRSKFNSFKIEEEVYIQELGKILANYIEE